MFFLGVRTTTVVAGAAFITLAAIRNDSRPLLAGLAWIFGFEAVYELTSLAVGHRLPALRWGPFVLIGVGIACLYVAARHGVWPSTPLTVLAGAVFLAWIASGFHVNSHSSHGFDATAEVLNESAKMLLAAAYLLPFRRGWALPGVHT